MKHTVAMFIVVLMSFIAGCAKHETDSAKYSQGLNTLQNGDSIILTDVVSSSPDFKVGDTVTVKGEYTLSSHPEATLLLSITATQESGKTQTAEDQRVSVSKGTGRFDLSITVDYEGLLHLTFYDKSKGSPIGGLYFGTPDQVAEAEKLMGKQ